MSHIPVIAASLFSGFGAAIAVAVRCKANATRRRLSKTERPFWVEVSVGDAAGKRPGESLAALRARRAAEELGQD